jgi:alkylation response protein AidB-like acyl-CoA dehydrogenase
LAASSPLTTASDEGGGSDCRTNEFTAVSLTQIKASAYAREGAVFGRPIGQNQGIQFPIAKAYAAMRAAELMVKEATRKYEAGLDCGAEANMAKTLAADASWEAANACVQTHGGGLCRRI